MRDRDVYEAIRAALVATGAFELVQISGEPAAGPTPATTPCVAQIIPGNGEDRDLWDPVEPVRVVQYQVVVMARETDPQAKLDLAELAGNAAKGVLSHKSFCNDGNGNGTMPGWTTIKTDRQNSGRKNPDGGVVLSGQFAYLVENDDFDVTP
jgi:hypothetical protein